MMLGDERYTYFCTVILVACAQGWRTRRGSDLLRGVNLFFTHFYIYNPYRRYSTCPSRALGVAQDPWYRYMPVTRKFHTPTDVPAVPKTAF